MSFAKTTEPEISLKQILKTWWPLAVSWLMMSIEAPALSAVLARLANPELNLAAYGGVIQPIRMIGAAPIVMLLSASNALCKDRESYRKVNRFMLITGISLSIMQLIIAITPAYTFIVEHVLGVPQELHALARPALIIASPLALGVGFRRFQQGILISHGHSNAIFGGTIIRLTLNISLLLAGYFIGTIDGVVVGAIAVISGIVGEAIYAGIRVRPVLKNKVLKTEPKEILTWKAFFSFYIPLVFTSLLTMIWQPISSAALSRMPRSIDSLATLPVVQGLVFMFRSFGMALNEVIVSMLHRKGSYQPLWKFSGFILIVTSVILLIIAATPLSDFWFEKVSGLSPELANLANVAIWIALPLPALSVLRSWYQGALLNVKKTRGISEAIIVSASLLILTFVIGVIWGEIIGVYVGITAFILANSGQAFWLWYRSKPVLQQIQSRDKKPIPVN